MKLIFYLSVLSFLCLSGGFERVAHAHGKPGQSDEVVVGTEKMSGMVTSIARTAVYTFLCIEVDGEPVWVATYPLALTEGDFVRIGSGVAKPHYYSRVLRRDFNLLYFVRNVSVVKS